jgi:hypothetical protein
MVSAARFRAAPYGLGVVPDPPVLAAPSEITTTLSWIVRRAGERLDFNRVRQDRRARVSDAGSGVKTTGGRLCARTRGTAFISAERKYNTPLLKKKKFLQEKASGAAIRIQEIA